MKKTMKKLIVLIVFIFGVFSVPGNTIEAAVPGTPPTPQFASPTIISETVTQMSPTSVILNGSVNPNGLSTDAWFEITSGRVGNIENIGSGISPVAITPFTMNGLSSNVSYLFRVVAQNSNGTTHGSWVTFSTNINHSLTLSSISPSSGNQGQNNLSVNLTGTGFTSGTSVVFSGSGITVNSTTLDSATSITVDISISNNAQIGGNNVVVSNHYGISNTQTFTVITSSCTIPYISSISPSSVDVNVGAVNVSIYGSNFNNSSYASYNGSQRSTNFINSNTLSVNLNSSDTSNVGSGNITVSNGTNCTSNSITFFVNSTGNSGRGGWYSRWYRNWNNGYYYNNQNSNNNTLYYVNVITQSATSITSTTSTLNGTINQNNYPATAWFEYGTSYGLPNYSETSHASTSGTLNFSRNIKNLRPNTTYYFRAVANNYAGTMKGAILSFTTNSSGATLGTQQNIYGNGDYEPKAKVNSNNVSKTETSPKEKTDGSTTSADEYFNNKNLAAASIFGFGNILPKSFLSWLIFIILILLVVIISRKIYEDNAKRKALMEVSANHIENLPV